MDALRVPLEIPLARDTCGDAFRDPLRHTYRCISWTPLGIPSDVLLEIPLEIPVEIPFEIPVEMPLESRVDIPKDVPYGLLEAYPRRCF